MMEGLEWDVGLVSGLTFYRFKFLEKTMRDY